MKAQSTRPKLKLPSVVSSAHIRALAESQSQTASIRQPSKQQQSVTENRFQQTLGADKVTQLPGSKQVQQKRCPLLLKQPRNSCISSSHLLLDLALKSSNHACQDLPRREPGPRCSCGIGDTYPLHMLQESQALSRSLLVVLVSPCATTGGQVRTFSASWALQPSSPRF